MMVRGRVVAVDEQAADDEVRVGSAQVGAAGEYRSAHPLSVR
jgi:hypothetical protein